MPRGLAVYKPLFSYVMPEIPGLFLAGKFKCCDQVTIVVTR